MKRSPRKPRKRKPTQTVSPLALLSQHVIAFPRTGNCLLPMSLRSPYWGSHGSGMGSKSKDRSGGWTRTSGLSGYEPDELQDYPPRGIATILIYETVARLSSVVEQNFPPLVRAVAFAARRLLRATGWALLRRESGERRRTSLCGRVRSPSELPHCPARVSAGPDVRAAARGNAGTLAMLCWGRPPLSSETVGIDNRARVRI